MGRLYYCFGLPLLLLILASGCEEERHFARVFKIENMAQTIGGPVAEARPGDYLLENDRIRAVVHGRHNIRSTVPVANGSLLDLDIQRPHLSSRAGGGKDAFYEFAPLVNLKSSTALNMHDPQQPVIGPCHQVGNAPCPDDNKKCMRITTEGRGDNILGVLGLLDLAIQRQSFNNDDLVITTDFDVCPDESFVRISTTARFEPDEGLEALEMEEFDKAAGVLEVLLGEDSGIDCAQQTCPTGQECVDLLINLKFGNINMEMKRCREPGHLMGGVLGADLTLFSGKVNVFIAGNGFDHESLLRSRFDVGQDTFSNPLDTPYMAAVGEGVSYAYFNATGILMVPAFTEAFTAAMTNRFACPQSQPDCIKGKKLRFSRFVAVGHGDIASALASFYRVRGLATGQVEGHVVDARTRKPVSDIDVYAFSVPQSWQDLSDKDILKRTWRDLVATHQQQTRTDINPDGDRGIISHFKTDIGLDRVMDGSFSGPLPLGAKLSGIGCPSADECRYILMAHAEGRPASRLYPIRVRPGATSRITLVAAESATLTYDVVDQSGRPLPSKLTIGHCFAECASDEDCTKNIQTCDAKTRLCVPHGGYSGPTSCRPDQSWDASRNTCACRVEEGLVPLFLGGRRNGDNTVMTVLSASGKGQVQVKPGSYQVIVSRGFEYEISRHFVTLRPGMRHEIKAVLPRVVDTSGWISADFHVHGPNSLDSGLTHEKRVASYVAEGVELITATDHDHITDYSPTIFNMALHDWIKSQSGVEVSPLDYGHFIGFPVRFDDTAELNGAFHWRVHSPQQDPTLPDWENMVPAKIYRSLREIGSLGLEKTVVYIAHFYDHFHHFDLDPFTMNLPAFNLLSLYNPVLQPAKFSGEFDALEAFNGKQLDVLRRPTYKEAREYNIKLSQAIEETRTLSYDQRQQAYFDLSVEAQRQFMERTVEEQRLAIAYDNPNFECRCATDSGCGPGSICDGDTGACTPSCSADEHCDAALVSAGREACLDKGGDPGRKTCQRIEGSCTTEADCTVTFSGATESCVNNTCQLRCTADKDCKDPLRPVCDSTRICVKVAAASDLAPCITIRGTIDDWFQLLNRGVYRTLLGNSDSHDTYGTEAGIPRNYVMSGSDLPQRIDIANVADQVHSMRAFATYGPFVEMTLDGQPLGSIVKIQPGQTVSLELKIQSPLWFDVDRVEIYRNGALIKEINGTPDCSTQSMPCIRVPNDNVINFKGTFKDTPERDAWYAVTVMGLDGKTMAPVYSSTPVARLGMFEFIQRLTPLLPPLRSFGVPLSPSLTVMRPYAATNPIFVDVDGDGLTPVAPTPGWAPETNVEGQQSSALKSNDHDPDFPGHDHGVGLGRLRMDTRRFKQMVSDGIITKEVMQKAMNQLRYLGRGH